jgi:transcriptional regulator with PAS, ATPase and Fis domain
LFNEKNEYAYALAFSIFGGASALTADTISFVVAIIGALFTASVFVFKKANKILDSYNNLTNTVEKIHSEIFIDDKTTIKKVVLKFQEILEKIEKTQKIIEQRSKSSLHYNDYALFETDKNGSLTWANEKFWLLSGLKYNELIGNDWYSIIEESKRERFIEEFSSCIKMCRKLDIKTKLYNGSEVRFYGQPYKIANIYHEGFLFKVTI